MTDEQCLLGGLDQLAADVAEDLGLRCVDDIEALAIVAYSAVAEVDTGPRRRKICQELRRQIVIWAFEEGQEGGVLPLLPAPSPFGNQETP